MYSGRLAAALVPRLVLLPVPVWPVAPVRRSRQAGRQAGRRSGSARAGRGGGKAARAQTPSARRGAAGLVWALQSETHYQLSALVGQMDEIRRLQAERAAGKVALGPKAAGFDDDLYGQDQTSYSLQEQGEDDDDDEAAAAGMEVDVGSRATRSGRARVDHSRDAAAAGPRGVCAVVMRLNSSMPRSPALRIRNGGNGVFLFMFLIGLICRVSALNSLSPTRRNLLGGNSRRATFLHARASLPTSKKTGTKKKVASSKPDSVEETLAELMRMIETLDQRMNAPNFSDGSGAAEKDQTDLLNGVVRIYCTHSPPNFSMPWQRLKQEFSTSTGFVIGAKQILTNAHAVEFGSLIQVKRRESEDKFVASVVAVGHECDLAILTVEDESFWKDLYPLKIGAVPDLQEEVSVVGYPVGGDSISISSGVVSRIEMQEYAQASAQLLAIQIDAAINPGNSGGPVVNTNNEVIGVAFQSLSEEDIENIGYVVPSSVINHFLNDVAKHGSYSGVSSLGVRMQGMENEVLRRYHGMKPSDTGALILATAPLSPASAVLEKNDVLLAVDGIRVANDCTIPFRDGNFKERVQVNYHFTQRFANDVVTLDILRAKKRIAVKVPLWVPKRLVPRTLTQKNVVNTTTNQGTGSKGSIVGGVPSYMIIGGLVMMTLSQEYLSVEFDPEHMGDFERWTEELRLLALADAPQPEHGEEVVILSQVISHTCNIGYETYRNMHLKRFNGETVKSLKHLKELVDLSLRGVNSTKAAKAAKKDAAPLVFEFASGQLLVLEAEAALTAQAVIASEHFIPTSSTTVTLCSDDFRM